MSETKTIMYSSKKFGFWVQLRQNKLPWIPLIILGIIVFATIFAPLLTPFQPEEMHLSDRLKPPAWQDGGSSKYPLGTDTLGRDILTRILFGSRISLMVAIIVLAIGGLFGLSLGIIAGYKKGLAGIIIMRMVDSLMAIPGILIALVFAMTLGPSINTVIIAISAVMWVRITRVIRGEVLSLAENAYVLQAKVAGCSQWRIMIFHILPNTFNTFLVLLSLNLGWVILSEAILSFLGAGIPPPTPSWGQMVSEGRDFIASAWWVSFFPGLILALTVLAFNMLGDWLRDKLDPKLRQI